MKKYTVIFRDNENYDVFVSHVEAANPQAAFEEAALDHHVNSLLEDSSTFELDEYRELANFEGHHENLA